MGRQKHFAGLRMFAAAIVAAVPAIAMAGAAPALASTVQLTRYPYLTDVVTTNATLNWATDQSQTTGYATYGAVGTEACTAHRANGSKTNISVNGVGEEQWKAMITGLTPGTQYCYRLFFSSPTVDLLGSDPSPQFWSMIPSGSSTPLTFAVTADWGLTGADGTNSDQANLEQQIAASGARFILGGGDTAYNNGSQTNYGDLSQTGADISDVFGPSFWKNVGDSLPMFNALGNHGLNATFLGVWPQAAAAASSAGRYQMDTYCCVNGTTSASYPSTWYALDAGTARIYVLDASWSNANLGTGTLYSDDNAAHWTIGDPEYQWLASDLAAHPSGLKFAVLHFPMYSDSTTESTDPYMHGPGSVGALLSQYGVQFAFNGHAHFYERNTRQPGESFVSYVVGGGGATLEPVSGCGSYDAYAVGWSPSKSKGYACGAAPIPTAASQVFSYLRVSVSGTQVTIAPTDETGRTFDVQTFTIAGTTTLPDTVIDTGPAAQTNQTSATFTFHSTQTPATFQCQLDGATAQACTTPTTYSGLTEGSHNFSVQATTTSGTDPTPATATWTIDTTLPTTPTITSATASTATTVNLVWTAATDANGIAAYDITRNGTPLTSVSGAVTSYSDTTDAANTTYQYQVVARDPAGNVSAPSNTATVTTPSASSSGPMLVQAAGTATSTGSTTSTVTLPASSTAGDLLVLSAGVYTGLTNQITSVTDSAGNTWTRIGAYAVSGHNSDGEMWYSPNAKAVNAVTAHTSSATTMALEVQEFSGIATTGSLDVATGTSNTSTTASSGSVTPTAANDLAVGFVAGHNNGEAITVTAPGYTVQPQQSTTGTGITTVITGLQVLTSASSQTMTGGFAQAMYWSSGIATFKAAN